ncbi:MAG: selD-2, partial [Dehalococcoidia bacterium]|nr:selD-2 [Dehalococcoidia bacterium]
MLRQLPSFDDPNLLVGTDTLDDAGVYRINDDFALVQTVDFFPPVVDDPYFFGAIAAANAVSDIYAMGAVPITALNILCFPEEGLGEDVLGEILRGGHDKAHEAGFVILGGHTIKDTEPKYGMAVTGIVKPGAQVTNAGAKPGDQLVLTKPLGIGIITTAIKRGLADEATALQVMEVMSTLNKEASRVMVEVGVNACTDVTGYGLLGHLMEMAQASGLTARVKLSQVPVMEQAWGLARDDVVPGGSKTNREFLEAYVSW